MAPPEVKTAEQVLASCISKNNDSFCIPTLGACVGKKYVPYGIALDHLWSQDEHGDWKFVRPKWENTTHFSLRKTGSHVFEFEFPVKKPPQKLPLKLGWDSLQKLMDTADGTFQLTVDGDVCTVTKPEGWKDVFQVKFECGKNGEPPRFEFSIYEKEVSKPIKLTLYVERDMMVLDVDDVPLTVLPFGMLGASRVVSAGKGFVSNLTGWFTGEKPSLDKEVTPSLDKYTKGDYFLPVRVVFGRMPGKYEWSQKGLQSVLKMVHFTGDSFSAVKSADMVVDDSEGADDHMIAADDDFFARLQDAADDESSARLQDAADDESFARPQDPERGSSKCLGFLIKHRYVIGTILVILVVGAIIAVVQVLRSRSRVLKASSVNTTVESGLCVAAVLLLVGARAAIAVGRRRRTVSVRGLSAVASEDGDFEMGLLWA